MKFTHHIGDDLSCTVYFDYTAGQLEIIHPSDNAQPGYPAEIEITAVIVNDVDIVECLNKKCLDRLEIAAWEYMENV